MKKSVLSVGTLMRLAIGFLFLSFSTLLFAQEWLPILIKNNVLAAGRATIPDQNEWVLVEVVNSVFPDVNIKKESKPLFVVDHVFSLDCKGNRIEELMRSLRVSGESGGWVRIPMASPGPVKYEGKLKGFKFADINHLSIDEYLDRQSKWIKELSDEIKTIDGRFAELLLSMNESKRRRPVLEEVVLVFGCAVGSGKFTPKAAADYVLSLAWIPSVKSIVCTQKAANSSPIRSYIKFDEERQFLQLNGRWIDDFVIAPNYLNYKLGDFLVYIDRMSGDLSVKHAQTEEIISALSGKCEPFDEKKKF